MQQDVKSKKIIEWQLSTIFGSDLATCDSTSFNCGAHNSFNSKFGPSRSYHLKYVSFPQRQDKGTQQKKRAPPNFTTPKEIKHETFTSTTESFDVVLKRTGNTRLLFSSPSIHTSLSHCYQRQVKVYN